MGCGASARPNAYKELTGPPERGNNSPKKEFAKGGGTGGSQFIVENKGKIIDFYDLEKKRLGEGSYGYVNKARQKGSGGAIRAVKTMSKSQLKNLDSSYKEIAIMGQMDHPNIVKLYETFEDLRNIYLVMEVCSGGELFDRILDSGHFTEREAAILMQQTVRSIYYLHENKVCHRDLKPENFLFVTRVSIETDLLKLIDFGLATKFGEGKPLKTKAGTPYYVAPQVLQGSYDQSCDMWSLGVIMYVMLCGYPPFFGNTDREVLIKVRAGNFSFQPQDWQNISKDAKDLIRLLIRMSPKERFTAEQALNHTWIKHNAPQATKVRLDQNFVDKLRTFRSQNRLKKAALQVIAGSLDQGKIKKLRDTFMSLDANGDGQLTSQEMREGLAKSGLQELPSDLQQILEDLDADGSGVIDYTEFLSATLDKRNYLQEDVLWTAFRVFDRNGDGKISQEELKTVLGSGDVQGMTSAQALKELMEEVDANGDGEIDFQEFMTMMQGKSEM